MNFGPLFEMPPAVAHRETSVAAAESMRGKTANLRAKVLACVKSCWLHGATCDELEVATGLTHQTCSARVHELMRLGAIVEGGRRKTRSGRAAIVWVVAP